MSDVKVGSFSMGGSKMIRRSSGLPAPPPPPPIITKKKQEDEEIIPMPPSHPPPPPIPREKSTKIEKTTPKKNGNKATILEGDILPPMDLPPTIESSSLQKLEISNEKPRFSSLKVEVPLIISPPVDELIDIPLPEDEEEEIPLPSEPPLSPAMQFRSEIRESESFSETKNDGDIVIKSNNTKGNERIVKKPKVATRLNHYIQWIKAMKIWQDIFPETFYLQFKSGLLLCAILSHIIPDLEFKGLFGKACAKTTSISNIEKGLEIVWRRKVLTSNMPTAERVFNCEKFWIDGLMKELFNAFINVEVQKSMPKVMNWINNVVSTYGAPLSMNNKTLWQELASGTRLLCLLHHFNSSPPESRKKSNFNIDSKCIWWNPLDLDQHLSNINYLFLALKSLGIPIVTLESDYMGNRPEIDFLNFQLYLMHKVIDKSSDWPIHPAFNHNSIRYIPSSPSLSRKTSSSLSEEEMNISKEVIKDTKSILFREEAVAGKMNIKMPKDESNNINNNDEARNELKSDNVNGFSPANKTPKDTSPNRSLAAKVKKNISKIKALTAFTKGQTYKHDDDSHGEEKIIRRRSEGDNELSMNLSSSESREEKIIKRTRSSLDLSNDKLDKEAAFLEMNNISNEKVKTEIIKNSNYVIKDDESLRNAFSNYESLLDRVSSLKLELSTSMDDLAVMRHNMLDRCAAITKLEKIMLLYQNELSQDKLFYEKVKHLHGQDNITENDGSKTNNNNNNNDSSSSNDIQIQNNRKNVVKEKVEAEEVRVKTQLETSKLVTIDYSNLKVVTEKEIENKSLLKEEKKASKSKEKESKVKNTVENINPTKNLSQRDIDNIFKWSSEPRVMYLKETGSNLQFTLIKEEKLFYLVWKNPDKAHSLLDNGRLALCEVKRIAVSPSAKLDLEVSIDETSLMGMRDTGALSTLTISFSSIDVLEKYKQALDVFAFLCPKRKDPWETIAGMTLSSMHSTTTNIKSTSPSVTSIPIAASTTSPTATIKTDNSTIATSDETEDAKISAALSRSISIISSLNLYNPITIETPLEIGQKKVRSREEVR